MRDELTAEWAERGAEEGREFAILTDVLHKGAFDLTTAFLLSRFTCSSGASASA